MSYETSPISIHPRGCRPVLWCYAEFDPGTCFAFLRSIPEWTTVVKHGAWWSPPWAVQLFHSCRCSQKCRSCQYPSWARQADFQLMPRQSRCPQCRRGNRGPHLGTPNSDKSTPATDLANSTPKKSILHFDILMHHGRRRPPPDHGKGVFSLKGVFV